MSDNLEDDFGQVGFRVPTVVVSPWTRGGRVDHTVLEHSSILRFIEDNYGLPRLTMRDANTNSIASAFGGFSSYDPELGTHRLHRAARGARPRVRPGRHAEHPRLGAAPPVSDLHRLVETGFADAAPGPARLEVRGLVPVRRRQFLGGAVGVAGATAMWPPPRSAPRQATARTARCRARRTRTAYCSCRRGSRRG